MKKTNNNNSPSLPFADTRLTFADFFCGCGGFSLGLINAGMKCISAMDISADALNSYWVNLCAKGWSHFYIDRNNSDIKKIQKWYNGGETLNRLVSEKIPDNWLSPDIKQPMPCLNVFCYSINDIEPEEWMKICGVRPGDISVFVGGPPCQGFSTSNQKRNELDERNQLPLRFIHYCKVCRPKTVIIENVPGILSLGKKKGSKEGPFPIWIREKFEEAGYDMEYRVIKMEEYGLPQKRHRVIFWAWRKDCNKQIDCWPEKVSADLLKDVMETIGHLPPLRSGEEWSHKITENHTKGNPVFHPYGYNPAKGYVICPACLQYVRDHKQKCGNCGCDFSKHKPINGGILHFPGIATFIGTQKPINNDVLRRYFKNYSELLNFYR